MDKTKILMENSSHIKVESIAECILQYFWPALSHNRYWKPIFGVQFEWPLKTSFRTYQYGPTIRNEFSVSKITAVYHMCYWILVAALDNTNSNYLKNVDKTFLILFLSSPLH